MECGEQKFSNSNGRRRNTSYKSAQPVAQHWFVARFGSMFGVFHLAWSTFVASWRNAARWSVDLLDPRQVASLLKNEQQSQNLLLKVDPRSTSRNKFLNPQYIFVARQVDRPKTCNEAMLRDTLRVFVFRISPPERNESAFLVLQKQARNRLFSNALSQLLRMILSNLSRGLTWILTLHSF